MSKEIIACIKCKKDFETLNATRSRKCLACHKQHRKEYRIKYCIENPEQIKASGARYREKNRKQIRIKNNKWYEDNKIEVQSRNKTYREDNVEALRTRRLEKYKQMKEAAV